MKTYAYGFPRLGKTREFKKTVESFWKKEIFEKDLLTGLLNIQETNIKQYSEKIDCFPDREMTLYDPMLDTAIMLGVFDPQDSKSYYDLCRDESAFEMKKWFNTNYHYLITDFSKMIDNSFQLNWEHFSLLGKSEASCPSVIGPFTFLKLSKGLDSKNFEKKFFELILLYKDILSHVKKIQIEEPAFVCDLDEYEVEMIAKGYRLLEDFSSKIILMTYYESVDWMPTLLQLPFFALGLDFVRGKDSLEYILKNGFPSDKTLIAGIVDGRNIWKNNIGQSLKQLRKLSQKVDNLFISNAAPLFHLPFSLKGEDIDSTLKSQLSFAIEKLEEIHHIGQLFDQDVSDVSLGGNKDQYRYGFDAEVNQRLKKLSADDFVKNISIQERREIHDQILNLPIFPTTTIGSFPQTKDVRSKRSLWRKGEISDREYESFIYSKINELIAFQEKLELDVLVHGEFERTDMVEFFAKHLKGIATTQQGWVLSYGTRVYRPPIIYGDVSRPHPMSVKEIAYAQKQTKQTVKGMLTGAVTIIAWSFCREDIEMKEVAYQISLSIRDEIRDYEKEGIKIVQVDEAAFREMAPLKKRLWNKYFEWAVQSFNLATNTSPETQIHTHMCYSKFSEIIHFIAKMDFDVISIEASKSRGEIIASFEDVEFKAQIGLGVWDIHSIAVPTTDKIKDIVQRSLRSIPQKNFWLNPDCGLKTRDWEETEKALKNMISVALELRTKSSVE